MSSEKICFIISPIGEPDSDDRKLADEKYDLVYKPVLEKLGYTPIRADKENSSNSISRGIVKRLIDSKLVIADTVGYNANVFYELAIRNAIKKPVIIIKELGQKLPFDVADKRAISINMKDNRQWTNAKEELEQHIINAEKDPNSASESILSDYAFDLKSNEKPNSEQEVVLMIKDLKDELRSMRGDVKNKITFTSFSSEIFKKANFSLDKDSLIRGVIGVRWKTGVFTNNDTMRFEILNSKGEVLSTHENKITSSQVGLGNSISDFKTEDNVFVVRIYVNNLLAFVDSLEIH